MKKSKGVISLILIAVLTGLLGFTTIHGWGKGETGAAKNINLGLDLEGGVSITYQVKGDTPSEEDMADTIYKLQKRVEGYSTEATVYQEGDDRISIEIPGVSDANAILDDVFKGGPFLVLDAFNALPHVPGVVIAGRDDAEIRFGIHGEDVYKRQVMKCVACMESPFC